jgi:hypothetical protein
MSALSVFQLNVAAYFCSHQEKDLPEPITVHVAIYQRRARSERCISPNGDVPLHSRASEIAGRASRDNDIVDLYCAQRTRAFKIIGRCS